MCNLQNDYGQKSENQLFIINYATITTFFTLIINYITLPDNNIKNKKLNLEKF